MDVALEKLKKPGATQMRIKTELERLLKKHGYRRDDRPDHREWFKATQAFHLQARLDQNNPSGFNGFQMTIRSYLRWDPKPGSLKRLLRFLKEFY